MHGISRQYQTRVDNTGIYHVKWWWAWSVPAHPLISIEYPSNTPLICLIHAQYIPWIWGGLNKPIITLHGIYLWYQFLFDIDLMYHVCTMYVPCIYHVYSMYIPNTHNCVYHVYTWYVPCICMEYTKCIQIIFHVYALYIPGIYQVYIRYM
jgi:hypothetical protein